MARAADRDLPDLSIEELMNVEVTSVSKKAQKLAESAAAVYVISNEDIRRSGARNVPEALRLAPGVDVAAIGGGRYAVSIRGENNRFADKLLVLIDGRSIYTPLFSGVLWESQGPVLEDVDRIEVVRGPGAAIWGANAVNGVINIITRRAKDTQGAVVTAGGGTLEKEFATVRYGGHVLADTTYRIYGKTEATDASDDAAGQPGNDRSHTSRAGFRVDQEGLSDHLSVQGETFNLTSGDRIGRPLLVPPYAATQPIEQHNSGADLLGRWDKTLSSSQDISLQAYYDFTTITLPPVAITQLKTYDLEFEHRIHAGTRNEITWGLGYRLYGDRLDGSTLASFDPASRYLRIASLFAQDEYQLVPNTLRLTLGTKLEHESYTGLHFLPNARLLWDVNATNEAWLAASHAIRTPSVGERDGTVLLGQVEPPMPPFQPLPAQPVETPGNFGSERLNAYELGYRSQFSNRISLDLAGFFNRYRGLRQSMPDPADAALDMANGVPYIRLPVVTVNGISAETMGLEAALNWKVSDWWRLQGSYSRIRVKLSEVDFEGSLTSSPRSILSVRSSMDLQGTHFDLWLRNVSDRPVTVSTPLIPAYTTLDASVSWRLPYHFDLALVGQNLLQKSHPEFVSAFVSSEPLEVQRSGYLKLTWSY
ncbi:MAG: TonB-dependent receptor [Nevskia sp.]|nr:TonB-dependent receptor [Nevskia sp.]